MAINFYMSVLITQRQVGTYNSKIIHKPREEYER